MQIPKSIVKQFLRMFVPIVVIFGLVIGYLYSSGVKKQRAILEAEETLHISLGKQVMEKDMEAAIADLRVLSQHSEFITVNTQQAFQGLGQLAQEFLIFSQNKRHYDQLRFLGETGKEVIRINLGLKQSYIVPQDQLQDKSKRRYFTDTMGLKKGELFISPLDLNVEYGKVERPYKPVIRLATPVLYGQEKIKGIVVLNYLGSSLIQGFKKATADTTDRVMLLDASGFWMFGLRPQLKWGSQLSSKHTFKKQFPGVWERIEKVDEGHFYTSDGLFTFTTVYPLREGRKTLARMELADELGPNGAKDKEYHWKAVAHVPGKTLDVAANTLAVKLSLIAMPLLGLMVAGTWWQAQARVRRLEVDEALIRRVHQQAAVAELGQRALSGMELAALMDTTVEYIAQVLEVEYCKILELLDDAKTLVLRAGVGWKEGLVGRAIVDAGIDSQAGYTLACKNPVIVADLHQETRFTGPQLLHDHGVVSGMSIIIHGGSRPFGILGVHTSEHRVFTQDDSNFLLAVANILSEVIELEFAQAKTRLQASALMATADGIVITDRHGSIQWVNPAYTRLTGYTLGEVLGKNPRIVKSGKHDKAFYKRLWDTILSGKTWHEDLWNKRKDGSLYLEEESITPVLDTDGRIGHFIAIKRDISERRQLQRQLQQAQKMESIGQLTGGIAHDFNNMLTSIMGYTELAREGLGQYDNNQIEDCLGEVYRAGKRARDLVSQMLAFSRGGEGEFDLHVLPALIKGSLKMLGTTLPSSIEIDLQMESGNLAIMTNPVQLHQLVMNLCINARDAMEGKGRLTIGLQRESNIVKQCHSCHKMIRGDYIKLFVRDTGSGIHVEQLDRLFDPFYTTKEVGKGTGMGLSMVHGIMHDHDGHIIVETGSGKGTSFNLLFPAVDIKVDTVNRQDSDTKTSSDPTLDASILIVDDEVSVGGFIGELLKSHGCQTTVVTDSRLALSRFKQNPEAFDLVVTDQTMPGMMGVELAQSLLEIRPQLPVILCTGYSEYIDEAKAKSLGIRGYVDKPIETDKFLGLVENLLKSV